MFIVQKDSGIIPRVLTQILNSCVNGVTLADPDLDNSPIVYANKAFVDMTGYGKEEIVGRNCRFLQGDDRDQPQLEQLRLAIRSRSPIEVTLRNYRKHGELFYNKLVIKPLFDNDGGVVYFLGVQYDITKQVRAEAEIKQLNARLELSEKPS